MNVTKKTRRYLDLARRVARQSEHDHFKHGAVMIKGGSIINTSHNKGNYKKFGNRFRDLKSCGHATHHAELGCVLGLDKAQTQGTTVYVVRVNRRDEFRNSKPCLMCEEVLKFCGVKKVVYTTGENSVGSYKL